MATIAELQQQLAAKQAEKARLEAEVLLGREKKQTAIRSERSASGSDKASSGEGQTRSRA